MQYMQQVTYSTSTYCEAWWRFPRVDDFQPKGGGFDFRSSCRVRTLGKSFTYIVELPVRFGVKLRYSIRAVVGSASGW